MCHAILRLCYRQVFLEIMGIIGQVKGHGSLYNWSYTAITAAENRVFRCRCSLLDSIGAIYVDCIHSTTNSFVIEQFLRIDSSSDFSSLLLINLSKSLSIFCLLIDAFRILFLAARGSLLWFQASFIYCLNFISNRVDYAISPLTLNIYLSKRSLWLLGR